MEAGKSRTLTFFRRDFGLEEASQEPAGYCRACHQVSPRRRSSLWPGRRHPRPSRWGASRCSRCGTSRCTRGIGRGCRCTRLTGRWSYGYRRGHHRRESHPERWCSSTVHRLKREKRWSYKGAWKAGAHRLTRIGAGACDTLAFPALPTIRSSRFASVSLISLALIMQRSAGQCLYLPQNVLGRWLKQILTPLPTLGSSSLLGMSLPRCVAMRTHQKVMP